MPRIPKYSLHKASGQARVCIDGRDEYLGPYGSSESKERYRTLVERWQLRRRGRCPASMTVGQLVLLYDDFARGYYLKNGTPTSEPGLIKLALRPLVAAYARTPVCEFGPRDLKAVRAAMVETGKARSTVNGFIRRIVRMFRWAVGEEYCPPDVLQALSAVDGLRKGRTTAREPEPIGPVPAEHIEATLGAASSQVRDLIQLQLLTGGRPGELLAIRPCNVVREGEAWEYVPGSHKTEHHGQGRRLYIGPKAQAILAPYLDSRLATAFCFSPAEAVAESRARRTAARKTPLSCGNRAGKTRKVASKAAPGDRWTANSYRHAIHDACDKAGVPRWSPNRLRHSRATELRRRYGIEAARTVLGHASLGTTEIYAEANFAAARQIMAEVG